MMPRMYKNKMFFSRRGCTGTRVSKPGMSMKFKLKSMPPVKSTW